ncbi:hypothetical protein LOTGIDRAFT_167843 [Lottia gigantea]|uniref:Apple domain-containing protein n=1 Tax=Lottia gigantea TaxID=225164 RepID=V4B8W2_LOTGI|nr:hypothetical protein LOTGIDRAFT_167843 [Lottia gigantea]ESO85269.1 hypothetical protein LOTGIDRAFT_167843 [Lottia gigantea]
MDLPNENAYNFRVVSDKTDEGGFVSVAIPKEALEYRFVEGYGWCVCISDLRDVSQDPQTSDEDDEEGVNAKILALVFGGILLSCIIPMGKCLIWTIWIVSWHTTTSAQHQWRTLDGGSSPSLKSSTHSQLWTPLGGEPSRVSFTHNQLWTTLGGEPPKGVSPGCECSYKYLNKTCLTSNYFNYDYTSTEDDQCDENCKSITGCTASLFEVNYCLHYKAPVIFVSNDLDLNQCIEKCKERSDCVTLNSFIGFYNICFLLNVSLAELPDGSTYESNRCTIVEKIC